MKSDAFWAKTVQLGYFHLPSYELDSLYATSGEAQSPKEDYPSILLLLRELQRWSQNKSFAVYLVAAEGATLWCWTWDFGQQEFQAGLTKDK